MARVFQSRIPTGAEACESLSLTDPLLTALPPVRVTEELHLRGMKRLTSMAGGDWHTLSLCGCPKLTALPALTRPLKRLELDGCGIERLPAKLAFEEDAVLIVQNCHRLVSLPDVVSGGRLRSIVIRNCPRLEVLPALRARRRVELERMAVAELHAPLAAPGVSITHCGKLKVIRSRIEAVRVSLAGCGALEEFAAPETALQTLSLCGCRSLAVLPEGLIFTGNFSSLELDGCARLHALPRVMHALKVSPHGWAVGVSAEGCPLKQAGEYRFRWMIRLRGVYMEPDALLNPERIDPAAVLRQRNAEVRRVLLENLGMEKLLARTEHALIDEDTDAGGRRRLFHFRLPMEAPRRRVRPAPEAMPTASGQAGYNLGRFILKLIGKRSAPAQPEPEPEPEPSPGMETLGCRHLECYCPSTGRMYLLPVPPGITTCHAAAAWLAGFENPNDYAPVQET